tara:strand:- start:2276 stop:2665 length:390 start_codon:yes stop_codon:yes gene_type:complete
MSRTRTFTDLCEHSVTLDDHDVRLLQLACTAMAASERESSAMKVWAEKLECDLEDVHLGQVVQRLAELAGGLQLVTLAELVGLLSGQWFLDIHARGNADLVSLLFQSLCGRINYAKRLRMPLSLLGEIG